MPAVYDRVKETTTTTGIGTYTLAGAATGFRSFSVVGDGNDTYYCVTDGVDWEVGVGTYTSSGTTLSRDTILASSNAGSAVNWGAGSKDVFVTAAAQMLSQSFAAVFAPIVFRPQMNEPPASAFATLDTRNSHPVLDFDGTTDEEAVFTGLLPASYTGNGLTVSTFWAFTSATTGSLRVQTAFERIDANSLDIDADSFASFNSAGGSAPATSGQIIKVDVVHTSGAQMDSLVAGEMFRVKIRRDADGTSGTDDITTDAELRLVVVTETVV